MSEKINKLCEQMLIMWKMCGSDIYMVLFIVFWLDVEMWALLSKVKTDECKFEKIKK